MEREPRWARTAEYTVLAFGLVLVLSLVGIIASGIYLHHFYQPVEAAAWQDITTLHTGLTLGLFIRNAHRWFGVFAAIGTPLFGLLYTAVGLSSAHVVRRRLFWAATLVLIVVCVFWGPVTNVFFEESLQRWYVLHENAGDLLRRWYVLHETPGYLLAIAMAASFAGRPRARIASANSSQTDFATNLPLSNVAR